MSAARKLGFPMASYLTLLVSEQQPDADSGDEPFEVEDDAPACATCGSLDVEERRVPAVNDNLMPATVRQTVCANCGAEVEQ